MPGIEHNSSESDNFLFIGRLQSEDLKRLNDRAEQLVPQIGRAMKARLSTPIIKGRMTFFVFDRRYDYSEFGAMVEKRELPSSWSGHWNFDIVDAYGSMTVSPQSLSSDDDQDGLDALLTRQIVGTMVAAAGNDVPRWFSEGMARVYTSRLHPNDPEVQTWNKDLAKVVAKMSSADAFLKGQVAPEQADIVSYGFIRFLMRDASRFSRLLRGANGKATFEESFEAIFRASPAKVAGVWLGGGAKKSRKNTR